MALNTIADLSPTPASNVDFLNQNATGSADANTIETLFQNLAAIMARAYGDIGGLGTVGGSADNITLTSLSTYQTLEPGLLVAFKAASTNTTDATLNLDGLGAKSIRRQGDSALSANDIIADGIYLLVYDADYDSSTGAWVLLNLSSAATEFADDAFRIQDDGDPTKKIAFQASSISTSTTRTLTVQNANGIITLNDMEDQTVTGGARVTSKSLGTQSSGTLTLDPGDRPLQHYTNGGAHTLAPGSNTGSILLDITNNGSAGAITTSGWTKVTGTFTTTNGHKFRCVATIGNAGSLLVIQAMQ